MYHIVLRVRLQILLSEMFQDSHFDESLMMESLLVPARTVKAAAINKKNATVRSESERIRKNAGCIGHYLLRTRRVFFFSDRNSRCESSRDEYTVSAYLIILMAMCCPVL